jgi:hypothetical protein
VVQLVVDPRSVWIDGCSGQHRDHDLAAQQSLVDLVLSQIRATDVPAVPPDVEGSRVRQLLEESLRDIAVVAGVADEPASR